MAQSGTGTDATTGKTTGVTTVATTGTSGAARGPVRDGSGMRCVLCGEPNDCAQAARVDAAAGPVPAEPCWCVGRTFPPALLARAEASDGGAACVCRRCLAAAESTGPTRSPASVGG